LDTATRRGARNKGGTVTKGKGWQDLDQFITYSCSKGIESKKTLKHLGKRKRKEGWDNPRHCSLDSIEISVISVDPGMYRLQGKRKVMERR